MWAVGCILGEMIVGKPVFPGNSTMNQLERVLEVTGKPNAEDTASVKSSFAASMIDSIPPLRHKSMQDTFPGASADALDLIRRCLQFNPDKRITAYEALRHPFVTAFHNEAEERPAPHVLKIQVDDNTKYSASDYRDRLYREIARRKKEALAAQALKTGLPVAGTNSASSASAAAVSAGSSSGHGKSH